MSTGFDAAGLARLDATMHRHIADASAAGLVWGVARDDDVHVGFAGHADEGGAGTPFARDTIFRISSMTKPVTAVAALVLVEECLLRLDDPVDDFLPELADRRVLRDPTGRSTTRSRRPADHRARRADVPPRARHGLGALGPPAAGARADGRARPRRRPAGAAGARRRPTSGCGRLGTLPLSYQPGERWLYHTGADVPACSSPGPPGQPFGDFLHERILGPLGMADTGFHVPADELDRFGPRRGADPETGALASTTRPTGSGHAPAFAGGGDGLVSTIDDFLAFARMLLGGGAGAGSGPVEGVRGGHGHCPRRAGPRPDGTVGWGFGRRGARRPAGSLCGRDLRLGRRARHVVGERSGQRLAACC